MEHLNPRAGDWAAPLIGAATATAGRPLPGWIKAQAPRDEILLSRLVMLG